MQRPESFYCVKSFKTEKSIYFMPSDKPYKIHLFGANYVFIYDYDSYLKSTNKNTISVNYETFNECFSNELGYKLNLLLNGQ